MPIHQYYSILSVFAVFDFIENHMAFLRKNVCVERSAAKIHAI